MSVEQNIASMRRCFEEVWNRGNLAAVPELISERYVSYSTQKGETGTGLSAFEQNVKNWRTAIPDLHCAVDWVAGAGEWLEARLTFTGTFTGRWEDTEPTGRPIYHRFSLFSRYVDGKCVEATTCSNPDGLARGSGLPIPDV